MAPRGRGALLAWCGGPPTWRGRSGTMARQTRPITRAAGALPVLLYILRRLLALVPVLFGISLVTFFLIRLVPGDVVAVMLGTDADPQKVAEIRRLFGLDQPLHVQYLDWMGKLLRGDLGVSLRTRQPVTWEISQRLPVTLELALLSSLLTVALAIPIGILTAVKQYSKADYLATVLTILGVSIPGFWLGTMLSLVFALNLRWLPPIGYTPFFDNPLENLRNMILPTLSLSAALIAVVMRQTRSSMLEVIGQDYVRTARAKGLSEQIVTYRHALKNALIPVITVLGIQTGRLLGGAVVIEQVFALPGMGRLVVDSIAQRDYPLVQGVVMVIATVFVLSNFAVDLLYTVVDPRIKAT